MCIREKCFLLFLCVCFFYGPWTKTFSKCPGHSIFFALLFPQSPFESVLSTPRSPVCIASVIALLVTSLRSLHQGRVVLKNSLSSFDSCGRIAEACVSFRVGSFPTLTIVILHSTSLCLHKAEKEKSCPGWCSGFELSKCWFKMFNGLEKISFWTGCSMLEESFDLPLDLSPIAALWGGGDAALRLWLGMLSEGWLCLHSAGLSGTVLSEHVLKRERLGPADFCVEN